VWDEVLADALAPLRPDDARLAHELAAGALRMRRVLDARLGPLASDWRATSADLKDLLRIGAVQLLLLDKIPPYAAVQPTVEAAKEAAGPKAGRFVNAVLRRVADGAPLDTPNDDPFATHPTWLIERWIARYGRDEAARLAAHNDRRPDITLIPYRWDRDRLAQALADRDIAFRPGSGGVGLVVDSGRVATFPGYADGAFIVQDPAQHALLEFAAVPPGALVWDACAAPGGKALWLARTHRVVASDRSGARLARARDSATRCAVDLPTVVADARHPPFAPGTFDAVLVDAPCSATGTMRRHPDARWRVEATTIRDAARTQAAILDGVAPTVRTGGVLVYLTCSLEPEENEAQVNGFLSRHAHFRRADDDRVLFPPESGTDGGFGARLERVS
jgi:16S rRNA (cytosine967-C5)-methyltransferase